MTNSHAKSKRSAKGRPFCGFKGAGISGAVLGSEAGDGVLMELEHFLHEAQLVLQA